MNIVDNTSKNVKLNLYVPINLDLSAYGGHADYVAYFISRINQRIIFEKLADDAYAPLMSVLLRRVLGSRYKRTIESLIADGVIECDGSYQVNTKSKGYRLTRTYRGQKFQKWVATDPILISKLAALQADLNHGAILPVHRHLIRFLQQTTFEHPDVLSLGIHSLPALEFTGEQELTYTVCPYHRLHTPLTRLKKELRHYLSYQNKPLTVIDIANSQPLFLGIVLQNYFLHKTTANSLNANNRPEITIDLNAYFAENFQSESENFNQKQEERREGGKPSIMWRIPDKESLVLPDDVMEYIRLCESGLWYERLMKLSGYSGSRESFKEEFFQAIFGKNHIMSHLKLFSLIEQSFPSVASAIKAIKLKDYRHLAHMLQRNEAAFVFNRVCARFMTEKPDMYVATIHDSWLVPTEEEDYALSVIYGEFARYGLRPRLKAERLISKHTAFAMAG